MNNIESTNTIYENPDKKKLVKDSDLAQSAANIEAGNSQYHSKSGRDAALEYLESEEKRANLGGEGNLEGEQVYNNEVFGQLFESVPLFQEIAKVDSNGDRYVMLVKVDKISNPYSSGSPNVLTRGVLLHSRYGPMLLDIKTGFSDPDKKSEYIENLDLNNNVADQLSKKYPQGVDVLASNMFDGDSGLWMNVESLSYNNSRNLELVSSAIKNTISDIEQRKAKKNPSMGDPNSAVAGILAGLN